MGTNVVTNLFTGKSQIQSPVANKVKIKRVKSYTNTSSNMNKISTFFTKIGDQAWISSINNKTIMSEVSPGCQLRGKVKVRDNNMSLIQ